MIFNEIEATFFEFTEDDSTRFKYILEILDKLLKDQQLGMLKSCKGDKAIIVIKEEYFQRSFLLLQNRLSMYQMQDLISFRLVRDKQGNRKKTDGAVSSDYNGSIN